MDLRTYPYLKISLDPEVLRSNRLSDKTVIDVVLVRSFSHLNNSLGIIAGSSKNVYFQQNYCAEKDENNGCDEQLQLQLLEKTMNSNVASLDTFQREYRHQC